VNRHGTPDDELRQGVKCKFGSLHLRSGQHKSRLLIGGILQQRARNTLQILHPHMRARFAAMAPRRGYLNRR
jgi:hypothetical protein